MIQIRFKRGNAAQNDDLLLGAGALSIDEENLTVRVHDGETVGGHSLNNLSSINSLVEQIDGLGIEDVDGLATALASKIAVSELGQALGVTQLNPEGVVPTEQLPSWVEEVLAYDDVDSLPVVGEVGKLYIVKADNELYRWSGSQERYYRISAKVESSDDLSQGQVSLFYTDAQVRDTISAQGSLNYDPETGVLSYSRSVDSVQGREGEVTIDQADVGLSEVHNFTVATVQEAAEAQVDIRYIVPARIRTFAEAMGFVDTESGWTFEPSPLPTLELQGIWTQLADGPGARYYHSAVALDGKMYVYGGVDGSRRYSDLHVYDPVADAWSQLANGPTARQAHSAVVLNGKMYVHGGHMGSSSNDLWVYDPVTDAWSQLANGPRARLSHSAVALGGKMYVYGGYDATEMNDLWVYNPDADSWSQLANGSRLRHSHSAVVLNGKMYVYGGRSSSNLNDLWVYNPDADSWSQLANGPSARRDHSAVVLDGKMYVYGGAGTYTDLWTYDSVTDVWTQLTDGPRVRYAHAAVVLNGKMYVYGGYGSGYLNELWMVE